MSIIVLCELTSHALVRPLRCYALPLELESIAPSLLLLKLEHIGTQAKLAQDPIPELLELAHHLVLLLILLDRYTSRKRSERGTDSGVLRR